MARKKKLSLFADDMILYIEIPKDHQKTARADKLVKSQVTKSAYRNLLNFSTPIMEQQKEKLRIPSHSQLHQKE